MRTIFENDIDKTSKAVTKILRQTQEGEITWEIDQREQLIVVANETIISNIYITKILDKHLRIYKYYYQGKDEFYRDINVEGIKLQFTNEYGYPEWSFPYSNAVNDLYEIIVFKMCDVEKFLDTWLKQ
jgi:hypothetical protein